MDGMFNVTSPFTMVVLIVAIVFGAKILRTHMLTRARTESREGDERIVASMQVQIDRLTDRVAVLERLVTDEDRDLARKIDRLRDNDRPGSSV
jgi:hypothetical protein